MKKLFTVILAVVLGLCCVSCDSNHRGKDFVATVKIGYYEAGYGTEFMDYWTEEYNKAHSDEKIDFQIDSNVAASSIGTSLENEASMNDIYLSLATNWAGWARSGWIEPIDDLYEMTNDDGTKFEDAFISGMDTYGSLDGHRYVVPQSGPLANGFVYSEKIFNQHGWKVPKTVEELYDLVDQINADPVNNDSNSKNDIAPFAWGGQVMSYWNAVVQSWWSQYEGADYMIDFYQNPSAEKYKNREGLKKALQIFENLICTGEGTPKNSLPGAMGKNHLIMQNDFIQGRAAMCSGVYGIVNETKLLIDDDFNMKIFSPAIDGAKTGEDGKPLTISVCSDFDFMFIAKQSNVKDYAKKFILWISTKDMASAYIKYTSGGSPYEYNPEKLDNLNSLTQSMIDATDDHFIVVQSGSDNLINQLGKITCWPMGEPYIDMLLNNKSVNKVLEEQYYYVISKWSQWEKDAGITT